MTNAWLTYTPEQMDEVMTFADNYKQFISVAKTERRFVKEALDLAKGFGYKNMNDVIFNHETLKPQDKVYFNMRNKALVLVQIGSDPLEEGMNILAAHIDSPRLDLKPQPLYQADGLAYFDTHYYGGIKKYQWVTMPLAIYGVICLTDGTHMDIAIGDHEEDPVFTISDLLPHLAQDQMVKTASEMIPGESLNLLIGSIPERDSKDPKEAVKANILALLQDSYGIGEEDFVSAELEVVPAGKARDLGLDRSMILAYGQDDRVCAYPSLMAQLECGEIKRTCATLLVDKEEIGSYGATGMEADYFENFIREILHAMGNDTEITLARALQNSTALSNDVPVAFDPNFAEAYSPNGNQARLGAGLCIMKYSGSRGKSRANDANAEYLARLRQIWNDNQVIWQISELGKVDQGGGGTVSWMLAKYGMQIVDSGVALQSMHAPFEISSKADLYETKKGYLAFLQKNAGKISE